MRVDTFITAVDHNIKMTKIELEKRKRKLRGNENE
jgi:hypothetical protein